MPSCRTDPLHTVRNIMDGWFTIPHRMHTVEVSIDGNTAVVAFWSITVIVCGGWVRGYGHAVGIVRGAQVLLHPALRSDFHRGIDVAVIVGHRVDAAVEKSRGRVGRQGGKAALLPVGRAHTVGGVGPDIIGGVGIQTEEMARKAARPAAVSGVDVAQRGILCCAPADSPCGHGAAAVIRHVAAAISPMSSRVRHHKRMHFWKIRLCVEVQHISQSCSQNCFSVCSIVIAGTHL